MSQTTVQFYTKSSDAWEAMLEDIRHATKTIILEQYIFTADTIGLQFIDLLLKKAKEGVQVRLLCDMAGSFSFYNSFYPEYMRKEGISIRFFNPIRPWRITNFSSNFFRDHRKILIVDDAVAHLGGVGIRDQMKHWRDTHMRITGPLIENIKGNFENVWEGVKMGFYIHYKPLPVSIPKYDLLINAPSIRQRYIYQSLISRIHEAKRYIYLTTPYFIPDVPFYRAMSQAAKRGVDVRLIVPQVADHIFIDHARGSYFTIALKAGIKIYTYIPTMMMHAKTAVIDDEWATAGSFNFDNLSFYFNHEANISSEDPHFIYEIRNHFLEDLKVSKSVLYEDWIKRPLRKKFLELLTWPFHGLL